MSLAFHIGYHKTATSWLQQVVFRQHPQIQPIANSAQPWDDPLVASLVAVSDRTYSAQQCRSVLRVRLHALGLDGHDGVLMVSAERLSGHPLSGGYDSLRIAERISAAFPEATIVCVIRNQPDMLDSVYRTMVRGGYLGGFDSLFESRPWRGTGFDLGFLEYDHLVERYQQLFGVERLCVLPYELLAQNRPQFLQRLCRGLGVHDVTLPADVATRVVNPSLAAGTLPARRLLNRLRSTEYNPFPLLTVDERLLTRVAAGLSRISARDRHLLTDEAKQSVLARYRGSNERLLRLVGGDWSAFAERVQCLAQPAVS